MKTLKFATIKFLDWIDDKILGHRLYWVCRFVGTSNWWDYVDQKRNSWEP